ncbi:acyltransferase [Crossiella sp. CA-258035]|uniref:acyltransferase family protein n=1 Tax=Crossiella sp. CA-258035 TaxID=2981138 RepID=UPI0024BCB1C9|nr:acyltransferase [Crossiella sp. CA-258035]WHT16505.1 acyltransferase [Crossiella sp. CA-258035]
MAAPACADTRPDRLESLTGLRAIAALAVFITHCLIGLNFGHGEGAAYLGLSQLFSYAAVSLFFVLSGFVLTWSVQPSDSATRFWRRRYVRVFPNHVLVLGLTLLFMVFWGANSSLPSLTEEIGLGPALAQVFLVHVWYPSSAYLGFASAITWSLACEVFFYFCFPLLHRIVSRIPARRLWLTAVAVFAAGLSFVAFADNFLGGQNITESDAALSLSLEQLWLTYFFPLSRLPEFILGMLMARLLREGRLTGLRLRHTAWLPLLPILACPFLPPTYAFGAIHGLSCALLVAAAAATDLRGDRSVLRGRAMVYLGDRSFAFYTVHLLTIAVLLEFVVGTPPTVDTGEGLLISVGLFLPCAALAAWLLHRYVEVPLVRRFSAPVQQVGRERVPFPAL